MDYRDWHSQQWIAQDSNNRSNDRWPLEVLTRF